MKQKLLKRAALFAALLMGSIPFVVQAKTYTNGVYIFTLEDNGHSGFDLRPSATYSAKLIALGDGYPEELTLPSSLRDNPYDDPYLGFSYPLEWIGDNAMMGCVNLKSVVIPNGVTSLGTNVFSGCKNLKRVTMPDSVTSIGEGAFEQCSSLKDVTIPQVVCNGKLKDTFPDSYSGITRVVIQNGATKIADGMFEGCTNLKEVVIPNSVTSIGSKAFSGCAKVKKVAIPQGVKIQDVFPNSYSSITRAEISDGATSIVSGTFAGCTSLEEVVIPNSVTSVPQTEFVGCVNLKSVALPQVMFTAPMAGHFPTAYFPTFYSSITQVVVSAGVTNIGKSAFSNWTGMESVVIPESVTCIGSNAFGNCSKLVAVDIPSGVTNIEYGTFCGCTNLKRVTIPSRVTRIGAESFSQCSSLETVVIPDHVKSLEARTFYGCTSLKAVVIPDSVESIGEDAFLGCTGLKDVTIPQVVCDGIRSVFSDSYRSITRIVIGAGVTSIGMQALYGCTSLKSVVISDSVTSIGEYAFLGCTSLESVVIPNGVTSIGRGAFDDCRSLKEVVIPDSVTSIGYGVFTYCTNLKSVVIPNSVTSIGEYAFCYCTNLKDVTIPQVVCRGKMKDVFSSSYSSIRRVEIADGVTSIGAGVFDGCTSLEEVVIPESVTSIGANAFSNTALLNNAEGDVLVVNGWLLGMTEEGRGKSEIVIPESVTSLAEGVFSGCTDLKSITIPQFICNRKIKDVFTEFYSSITQVVISAGVTSLGANLFDGCTGLASIKFMGTPPEKSVACTFQEGVTGHYLAQYAKEWSEVLDEEGKWGGLKIIPDGNVIQYRNLKGVVNPNPLTYEDGSVFEFAALTNIAGYTFVGWSSVGITAEMKGLQVVTAKWKANLTYTNLKGATHTNPAMYEEGTELTFAAPSAMEGLAFTGWTPAAITSDMTGPQTVTANWELVFVPDPVVTPADGAVFAGEGCTVSLTCALEGAQIYYTTNGVTPKLTDKYLYTGSFTITDSISIKAIAVYDEMKSEYMTAEITRKDFTLAEILGLESAVGVTLETDEAMPWIAILDASSPTGMFAQSATIGNGEKTWIKAMMNGKGTFSFKWKVDCEDDPDGASWDHVEVVVDGNELDRMDGATDWAEKTITFTTAGDHTIYWAYVKDVDESEAGHADCAWVTDCKWTPEESDPFPAKMEGAAFSEVKDTRLAEKITTAAEYEKFHAWVDKTVGSDVTARQKVKDSGLAWFAYALDLSALPEKAPTNVVIETIGSAAEGGWDLDVSIGDLKVGREAIAADLGTVFSVEGAADLKEESFSAENVTTSLSAAGDGKVKVGVAPKSAAGQFFIRVKMTP